MATDENYTSDDERPGDDNNDERPGALTTPARSNQIARRDFSSTSMAQGSASTDALVAKARADTEARWIMAMRNPRNLDVVRQDLMEECRRPGFADVATYARPVGKEQDKETGEWVEKFADGLSIRFAEVAMRCMSNMQCKAQTVYDDVTVRMITVTAVDYQSNATWEIDLTVHKTVERRKLRRNQRAIAERENSFGDRVYLVAATDQEVATKAAAEISKAARTCILRLIPGHLQDEGFLLCRKVAADRDAKDPKAARHRMMDAFGALGVSPTQLEEWLGHGTDAIVPVERDALLKIHSAIKEGEITWAEALSERLKVMAAAKAKAAAATVDPSENVHTPKPAAPAASAPAPRSTSTGKGTAALKGALSPKPAPSPYLDLPPDTEPPAAGHEYRACAGCEVPIEVPIGDPSGVLCGSCASAMRDQE